VTEEQKDCKGRDEDPTLILIVDDDPGIREVLEEALSHRGYRVQEAPDGYWVSRALREGVFPFDLVILDWKMPGLDGLAVLQVLRAFSPETPVIMVSIFADDALWVEALSLGAVDVLPKPIDFGELFFAVEKALHRCQKSKARGGEAL